jgi:hypothetical protein
MRNIIFTLLFATVYGCSAVRMVGDVNMISSRNIDSKSDYQLIKTGTDDSRANFRKNSAENIDQAINNVVMDVPGGEFLKMLRYSQMERNGLF